MTYSDVNSMIEELDEIDKNDFMKYKIIERFNLCLSRYLDDYDKILKSIEDSVLSYDTKKLGRYIKRFNTHFTRSFSRFNKSFIKLYKYLNTQKS